MRTNTRPSADAEQSRLALILALGLLFMLFLAGGASRADAIGQPIARAAAWLCLVVAILFQRRFDWQDARVPLVILGAAGIMLVLQVLPLPPGLWRSLPGREILAEADVFAESSGAWRPLALAPAATLNAIGSLVVPTVMLVVGLGLTQRQHRLVLIWLAVFIAGSALLGFLQVSGFGFDHPLVNDVAGEVSGSFANRNHFALFMAIGCAIAPTLAAMQGSIRKPFAILALGTIPVLFLLILATGSRTGLVVGGAGTIGGLLVVRRWLTAQLSAMSRNRALVVAGLALAAITGVIAASVMFGRAESVNRALQLAQAEDLRSTIRPTLYSMIADYFPAGTGFGGFDSAFRIYEPLDVLRSKYVNQAHNDFLSIALEGGLPGMLLLAGSLVWLWIVSARAWRADGGILARLGSIIVLLVCLASATDYPLRTPMMMAVLAIAVIWLARSAPTNRPAAQARTPSVRFTP